MDCADAEVSLAVAIFKTFLIVIGPGRDRGGFRQWFSGLYSSLLFAFILVLSAERDALSTSPTCKESSPAVFNVCVRPFHTELAEDLIGKVFGKTHRARQRNGLRRSIPLVTRTELLGPSPCLNYRRIAVSSESMGRDFRVPAKTRLSCD